MKYINIIFWLVTSDSTPASTTKEVEYEYEFLMVDYIKEGKVCY